ncbi:thermolabile hemolysin [Pantoea alhagi]|uniref:SGNH/GDSL hydrolase family protein n=1 Tax=Mixta sp. BE291 TaxID=3158787 RepID=UPI00285BA56B|nr:thermolabile hemolysin [Pantoea alhagi]
MERIAATVFLGLLSINSYAANHSLPASANVIPGGAISGTSAKPVTQNSINTPQAYRNTLLASNTSTYIKCTYKIDKDPTNPASSWVWAVYPPQPDRYAMVHGYWRDNSVATNMFYTNASALELKEVCQFTLKHAGIEGEVAIPYAGDSVFSYYYNFWSQGFDQPEARVEGVALDRLVVFGDSLSDTINVYNASYGAVPKNSAWFYGRFSNGPVWHEYWTNQLSIPSYVWATANAESGVKPLFPSFMEQLHSFKEYIAYAQGYDIKKTLFTVLFGGNDFITGNKTPEDIITNYRSGLAQLAHLGAAQVIIMKLPDFSGVPAVRDWKAADKQALKEKSVTFNMQVDLLAQELNRTYPGTRFIVLSLDKAYDNLITHANTLGYVNTKDTCLDIKNDTLSYMYHHNPRPDCKSSGGRYLFWDTMHPTTYAHADLSKMLFQELQLKLQETAPR